MISFSDLSEMPDLTKCPWLDQFEIPEQAMTASLHHWRDYGYLILREIIPSELIDAYVAIRAPLGPVAWNPKGGTPYMDVLEIKDLCLYAPLMRLLHHILGEPVGMHLNLTNWTTTERDWHQDSYLNPPDVGGFYIAAWFALDSIHTNSGPFQFVPGSHRWPVMTRQRIMSFLDPHERTDSNWPQLCERFVTAAIEAEIERRDAPVHSFLPANKGDVLLWHSALVHRGARAIVPGMERRAIITHYSGLNHRPDMPNRAEHGEAGHYFVL